MTDSDQSNDSNATFVDVVLEHIPEHTWNAVKTTLITHLIDAMPSQVLIKLTNDPEGYEEAETILHSYYADPTFHWNLINDSFQILGDEYVLILLDEMQLDKVLQS
tara:strand:- start:1109 stop:1426 length:318 start_codon:yes stop_codon:yes gene_type:complete